MNLPAIKANAKSGAETLSTNGKELSFSVLDFWRWSASDLVSNATRGRFAEFIVASAIGIDLNEVRDEWGAFDLQTISGIKIEVKSSGFIQSWPQKSLSSPSFSIATTQVWDYELFKWAEGKKRQADVYVFCLLKHTDQATVNPLQLEQWEFFVLPTETLNKYGRSQTSITLPSLRTLVKAIEYGELCAAIEKATSF